MNSRTFISLFYAKLYYVNPVIAGRYMELLGRDLEFDLDANAWSVTFKSVKNIFMCNKLRESQYRILHILQCTPHFLNKINPQISPLCVKCKKEVVTYLHCIWQCPLIARYFKNITKELSSIFHKTVKLEPDLFLLNIPKGQLLLSAGQLTLMGKLLLLLRRCVLFQWIKQKTPSVTQWYREIFKVFPMEHLSATLKGNDDLFYSVWQPFLNYLPGDLVDLPQKGRSYFAFTDKS